LLLLLLKCTDLSESLANKLQVIVINTSDWRYSRRSHLGICRSSMYNRDVLSCRRKIAYSSYQHLSVRFCMPAVICCRLSQRVKNVQLNAFF